MPNLFHHGHGFAGNHRLVHRGKAINHFAIRGDAFAGSDEQDIADHHIVNGDDYFFAIPQHAGGLGLQVDESADGFMRLALGPFVQIAP